MAAQQHSISVSEPLEPPARGNPPGGARTSQSWSSESELLFEGCKHEAVYNPTFGARTARRDVGPKVVRRRHEGGTAGWQQMRARGATEGVKPSSRAAASGGVLRRAAESRGWARGRAQSGACKHDLASCGTRHHCGPCSPPCSRRSDRRCHRPIRRRCRPTGHRQPILRRCRYPRRTERATCCPPELPEGDGALETYRNNYSPSRAILTHVLAEGSSPEMRGSPEPARGMYLDR